MVKNKRLEARRKKISKDIEIYVTKSFDIVDRIHEILLAQGRDQKYLAEALGKTESEISKWMTGTHNFTLKTISKIESVLAESIILTTEKKQPEKPIYVYVSSPEYAMEPSHRYSKLPVQINATIHDKYQNAGDFLN